MGIVEGQETAEEVMLNRLKLRKYLRELHINQRRIIKKGENVRTAACLQNAMQMMAPAAELTNTECSSEEKKHRCRMQLEKHEAAAAAAQKKADEGKKALAKVFDLTKE